MSGGIDEAEAWRNEAMLLRGENQRLRECLKRLLIMQRKARDGLKGRK